MDNNNNSFNLDQLKTNAVDGGVTNSTDNITEQSKTVDPNLPTESSGKVQEVDIGEIREYAGDGGKPTYMDKLFGDLDVAIERDKAKIDAVQQKVIEENNLRQLDGDDAYVDEDEDDTTSDGETSIFPETNVSSLPPKKNIIISKSINNKEETDDEDDTESGNIFSNEDSSFFSDLEDEDTDSEEDDNTEQEAKEQLARIKTSLKKNIVTIHDTVDLSQFSISKKPVSISKLINMESESAHVADWMLYSAKRPISVSELSGPEIERLNPGNTGRNKLNTYRDIYSIIYKHIIDANKPITLEAWVKTVKFYDINHLYFAMYKACFNGTNSVPYTCPECEEMFMEIIPIENMVKYASDEVKKEVQQILEKDSTSVSDEYNVDLVQVSDNYVIGLREPTVYNVIFETAALSDDFVQKYADLLGVISYIDGIYFIDRRTNTLAPVNENPDPKNAVKTTQRKIKIYYEILSTLSSDQYYLLNSKIKELNDMNDSQVQYCIPAAKCPKCGHEIPEEIRTPDRLLFTRHQLAIIANIS